MPLAQKRDLRSAEFPARIDDMLTDDIVRNAETRGDCLVRMTARQFTVDFTLARREEIFAIGGGLPGLEGFCQKRGNDTVLAIDFPPGGEKRDEAQFFHAVRGRQRIGDCFPSGNRVWVG